MVDNPDVSLTGLVFEAPGIRGVKGLEETVRRMPGVTGEHGFKAFDGARDAISIMFTPNVSDPMQNARRIAKGVVEALSRNRAEVTIRYVYSITFPGRRFTAGEVKWLRSVYHPGADQVLGSPGNLLQIWLNELVSTDDALETLRLIAARTRVGFL